MKTNMKNLEGSALVIALMVVVFLVALSLLVLGPVSTSQKVSTDVYKVRRADFTEDAVAERIKAIICRQDRLPLAAEGCSAAVNYAIASNKWYPRAAFVCPVHNNGTHIFNIKYPSIPCPTCGVVHSPTGGMCTVPGCYKPLVATDWAGVTFPTIDMKNSSGTLVFDPADPNLAPDTMGVKDSAGNLIPAFTTSYLAYTFIDGTGNAASYVSTVYDGEVRNMRVAFRQQMGSVTANDSYFHACYAANQWNTDVFLFLMQMSGTKQDKITGDIYIKGDANITNGTVDGDTKTTGSITGNGTGAELANHSVIKPPDLTTTGEWYKSLMLKMQNGVLVSENPSVITDATDSPDPANPVNNDKVAGIVCQIDLTGEPSSYRDPIKSKSPAGVKVYELDGNFGVECSSTSNEYGLKCNQGNVWCVRGLTQTQNPGACPNNCKHVKQYNLVCTKCAGSPIHFTGTVKPGACPVGTCKTNGTLKCTKTGCPHKNQTCFSGLAMPGTCPNGCTHAPGTSHTWTAPVAHTIAEHNWVATGVTFNCTFADHSWTTTGSKLNNDGTYDSGTDSTIVTVDEQFNNKAIYLKGDFWIDILNPININFRTRVTDPVTGVVTYAPTNLTFIVEGNVYMTDGINNTTPGKKHPLGVDGGTICIIARRDSSRTDSTGNVVYGDPSPNGGQIDPISAFCYAENNFKWLADAMGQGTFSIFGNMTAGGQIDFTARSSAAFMPLTVTYNPAIEDENIRANLPCLPPGNGDTIIPTSPFSPGGKQYIE